MSLNGIIVIGKELTAETKDAHNTFDRPNAVKPNEFRSFAVEGQSIRASLSPMSVTMLELTSK